MRQVEVLIFRPPGTRFIHTAPLDPTDPHGIGIDKMPITLSYVLMAKEGRPGTVSIAEMIGILTRGETVQCSQEYAEPFICNCGHVGGHRNHPRPGQPG